MPPNGSTVSLAAYTTVGRFPLYCLRLAVGPVRPDPRLGGSEKFCPISCVKRYIGRLLPYERVGS